MTHLAAAIRAVLPHVEKDDEMPSTCGIQIRNGHALATDRFSAARARITALHALEDDDALSQDEREQAESWRPDVDAFLTQDLAKLIAARKSDVITGFDVDAEGRVTVTFASGIIHSDIRPLNMDEEMFPFPPIERLFEDFKPGPMNAVTISPKLLARYNPTATGHDGPVMIRANERNSSLLVTIPDETWFQSLIASKAEEN